MRKLFCLCIIILAISGTSFAEHNITSQAQQKGIKLISISQAADIVYQTAGTKIGIEKIELDNEAKHYRNGTNFRPVYEVEFISEGQEYEIDIDAVTGEILKYKRD